MYSFVLTSRKNYVAGDVRINIEQNSRMELMGDGSLQLKNAQRSDQGDYTCVVFNEHSKDFITYILVVQGQSAGDVHIRVQLYHTAHFTWDIPHQRLAIAGHSFNVKTV